MPLRCSRRSASSLASGPKLTEQTGPCVIISLLIYAGRVPRNGNPKPGAATSEGTLAGVISGRFDLQDAEKMDLLYFLLPAVGGFRWIAAGLGLFVLGTKIVCRRPLCAFHFFWAVLALLLVPWALWKKRWAVLLPLLCMGGFHGWRIAKLWRSDPAPVAISGTPVEIMPQRAMATGSHGGRGFPASPCSLGWAFPWITRWSPPI